MLITRLSLRNPLLVAVVALTLICFGLYAYFTLGISEIPNVTFPGVQIMTTDSGADPDTVETQITKPIEDAVASLPNVDTITSSSSEGVSSISVQFTTAANAQLVPVDVERVVNAVRNQFPTGTDAPTIQRFDTSAFPIIIIALSGPQSANQLQSLATDRLQRSFEGIPGVQSVQVGGGAAREIHVKVDVDKLRAYGLGFNQVQQALQSEQLESPAGQLTSADKNLNVRLTALVTQPDQLKQIIVANTATGPVYLKDIAIVEDGFKTTQSIIRVNGTPAVGITITKLANGNAIQISQAVRQQMARLQPTLPAGAKMDIYFDTANYTQQSFSTIRKTLVEAVLFTGIILLLFLHTWRSTLIVLVAIPTSLLTAVGVMLLMGMDLNLFSMLALTLAVGILVDDSIVVLENIYRHLKLREPPLLATINGRSEIGFAALTITMVDVVVYLPMALIPGVAGQFLAPFALVIAAATLTSLVVSFTLTPLLASRFLSQSHALSHGSGPLTRFGRWWDRGFDRLANGYRHLLQAVLTGKLVRIGSRRRIAARWGVVVIGIASIVASLLFVASGRIGIDIFPSGDQSEVDVSLNMPPATSLDRTGAVAMQMDAKLRTYPEVREVFTQINSGSADFTVALVPPSQRTRSSDALSQAIRREVDPHLPGTRIDTSLPTAFGFGFGGGAAQPIQVTLRGPDPVVLNRLVDQVEAAIRAVPGSASVNSSNDVTQPEALFTVDRSKAADAGVTAQMAASALQTAINGSVVGEFRQAGQQNVDIRLMSNDAFRAAPDQLATLPLLSNGGSIVALGQIGTVTSGAAPINIRHYNRARSVSVNASASGRPVGTVQTDVQAAMAKIPLPAGYNLEYGGQASTGISAFADIFKALGVGIVLIYLLMTLLFGSLTLPLAVLMSLPLALFGALGAMALTATPFTVFSMLGFFLLLGLVGKNAILLVDYTDTLRKRGLRRTEALVEAGPTRLRPIVMTTASVMAALAPVALGLEPGSELLKAAAIVLIGGLLTSTLLTLLFVPSMYTIFDDVQELVLRLVHRVAAPRELEPSEVALLHSPNGATANGLSKADHTPTAPPVSVGND